MNTTIKDNHFDVIIVGSGVCGATIARELSRQKKKVLILERGGNAPLKESLLGMATIVNEVSVGDKLKDMRVIATGGSTALYFAAAELPPMDTFLSLGMDLSKDLEEVRKELPLTILSDELFGNQSLRLRESALGLGYPWKKELMLVDPSKCTSGYSYEAKWKAKSYVEDAVRDGAKLINRATVSKVIIEKNRAIGVEYKLGGKICQVYGEKIILAAGILASPMILKDSGIKNVANHGFYVDPNIVLFGFVPGLKGKEENFVGAMDASLGDGITLGDANVSGLLYRLLMLAMFKPLRLASHSNSIGIGVKVNEAMGGELLENGHYYKQLPTEVFQKLKIGEEAAIKILKNAGAKGIIKSPINVTSTGGVLRIQEHVDANLQTEYSNLYVCDRSVLPETFRKPPTLTLVCMGKYLARHLSSSF